MQQFGKYEVIEKIGEGGFGVIYKGFDPHIKRTVAIKICTSDDQEIRDRFFQEAEIVGNLQHRNLTIVFDFGIEDGVPYLIQEYLSGEDLNRKIKRQDPLSFGTKLLYLIQVARGLQYAHTRGVIHRDIKPGNIRVLADDTVKIMDFGIAKLAHGQTTLTQTGQTIGTAAYLAPEQIRGETIDHRVDIFSFGLLAYELVTFRRAFPGDNASNVLYQVLSQDPTPLAEIAGDCPPDMVAIINRCIAKNPDERFPTCAALLAELDHLLEGGGGARDQTVAMGAQTLILPGPTESGAQPLPIRSAAALAEISTLQMSPGIDNVDLAGSSHRTTVIQTPPARAKRGVAVYLFALVVMGLLGAGGWWYWERVLPETGSPAWLASLIEPENGVAPGPGPQTTNQEPIPTTTPDTGTRVATMEPTANDPSRATTPPAGDPEPGADTAEAPGTPAPNGTEQGTQQTTAAETEPEPEPEPPPPPTHGNLILPSAWDPNMTVSINGGRDRKLDQEQTLRLPADTYRLTFDLLGDYQTTREIEVRVRAGRDTRSLIPIPRPGRLTVRQSIGSPRGWVVADDEVLGWSPVQRKPLAPGDYEIIVLKQSAGTAESPAVAGETVRQQITVQTGREVIVTFDLRNAGRTQVVERPFNG